MRRLGGFLLLLCLCCPLWAAPAAPTLAFEGLPDTMVNAIKPNLTLTSNQNLGSLSNVALYLLIQQGSAQIKTALKPFGYYRATVTPSVSYDPWVITYRVTLGPPVMVTKVDITLTGAGKQDPIFQALLKSSQVLLNQPLSHDQYTALKTNLLNTANANGYLDAILTEHQIRINLTTLQATLVLTMDTGEQYHFGPIQFDQSKPTFRVDFLQRLNPIKTGAVYTNDALNRLQNNLDQSGYFSTVTLAPQPDQTSKTVPMTVKLQPTLPQQYTIGGGYGTDTGPRLLLGWKLRHITDTGQYFTSEMELSPAYSMFSTSYVFPGKNPLTDNTSINASQSFTDLTAYNARETLFGVTHVFQQNRWRYGVGLTQDLVKYTTQANSTNEHAQYLLPSINLSYVDKMKAGYWDQGFSTSVHVLGTVANPLSNATFFRGVGSFEYSHNLFSSNRFYTSTTLGGLTINDPQSLSPTMRFYAGGVDSLRGFAYKTVSPENTENELTGGKFLWVSQFNLEQHLFGDCSGIVFYDIGNAFNSWQHVAPQQDAGVGAAWQTPVGPLSVYVARALTAPGVHWQLSLGIGASL